jgi:hypothetical protein
MDSRAWDGGLFMASKGELCVFQTGSSASCPVSLPSGANSDLGSGSANLSSEVNSGLPNVQQIQAHRICACWSWVTTPGPPESTDRETEAQKGEVQAQVKGQWKETQNPRGYSLLPWLGLTMAFSCGVLDKSPNLLVLSVLLCKVG